MDLLLHLIRKNEVDIYDIPIARITDQFIQHIEVMQTISLDKAGEFIAMAATLLVIKMKMLMPRHGEAEDDEIEEDPRAELVRRLLERGGERRGHLLAGLPDREPGAAVRRDRRGQGCHRKCYSPQFPSEQRPIHPRQLWRDSG